MTSPTPARPTHRPPLPGGSAAGVRRTDEGTPADLVAEAVLGVPGVVSLHPGMFGEVATYLPGRRVPGVQVRDDNCQIHVVLKYSADIHHTAEAIRAAAGPLVHTPVHVTVQDLLEDEYAQDEAGRDKPQ